MNYKHILVTTDFSEDSLKAFDIAAYEAKMADSKITLLSVVADWDVPPAFMMDIANPESITKYRNELRDKAEEELKEYAKDLFHGQKVETKAILSDKPTAEEIVSFAKDNDVNLIVLATHGRGSVGRFFLGSVAQKVLQNTPCPVLVVPKADES